MMHTLPFLSPDRHAGQKVFPIHRHERLTLTSNTFGLYLTLPLQSFLYFPLTSSGLDEALREHLLYAHGEGSHFRTFYIPLRKATQTEISQNMCAIISYTEGGGQFLI